MRNTRNSKLINKQNWFQSAATIVYGNVDAVTVILGAVTASTFVACSDFFFSGVLDAGSRMTLGLLVALLLGRLLLLEMMLLLLVVGVIVSGDMLLVLSISIGCSSSMSTYSMALSSSSCSSITKNYQSFKLNMKRM